MTGVDVVGSLKECTGCQEVKPRSRFSKRKDAKDGLAYRCKDCHALYSREKWYPKNRSRQIESSGAWKASNRTKVLATRYRVSSDEIERVETRSEGRCEACGSIELLQIDHCHESGRIRGVLCANCNSLLGRCGDNLENIRKRLGQLEAYLLLS